MPVPSGQHLIPIEALAEYEIRELLLDGQEILEKPLTPVANFQRIVNQLDFSEDSSPEELELPSRNVISPKIWETVKETMRTTMIEINALVDVLGIIKEGKYLALNPVADDPLETNLPLILSGKKRSIAAAADILIKGAERLRRRHSELADARIRRFNPSMLQHSDLPHNSFHMALMHLRQEWRLKLYQNSILGDVSLRSVGSHFKECGNFEIRESDIFADQKLNVDSKDQKNVDPLSGVTVIFSQSMEALLNVSRGSGGLSVRFVKSDVDSQSTSLLKAVCSEQQQVENLQPLTQRQKLFKAQRLLECREILFQLAYEACNSRGRNYLVDSIACVTQEEIVATLFPGVQISISLNMKSSLNEDDSDCVKAELVDKRPSDNSTSIDSCSNSLHIQLHRMLAAQHRTAWPNLASLPQPTCGPVQVPLYYRAAGADGLPASEFSSSLHDSSSSSGCSVAVASVSGFAAQVASAWSSLLASGRSHLNSVDRTDVYSQRLQHTYAGQDRLSMFTEWGHSLSSGNRASSSVDDSVPVSASLTAIEHALLSRGADDNALKTVVGTNLSLFSRTIRMCRHYYLRDQVYDIISEFSRHSPVKIISHWDCFNSAYETSVRLCFYCTDYDAYRTWIGVTVKSNGISVSYSDAPRIYRIGTDLKRLKDILKNQVLHAQMNYLDILAIKILGWVRLGNNPFSGIPNPEETTDSPVVVKIFASPSGEHLVCLRGSAGVGIQLFINNRASRDDQLPAGQRDVVLNENYREVILSSMYGKHLVAKVEAIMTLLS
uniref:Mediator of RNA polymerase II transcription subunit 17 n=1 Tax=Trichobilharzia regenti TaxID=157069 RepID=A0AA85K114_TRIRE|nr:unnamed protein product [Trichobilharzia regenti]